jgi:hypothetical protein
MKRSQVFRVIAVTFCAVVWTCQSAYATGFTLDQLRDSFIANINDGNFILPKTNTGGLVTADFTAELAAGSRIGLAGAKAGFLAITAVNGGILGGIAGSFVPGLGTAVGAGIGASIGLAAADRFVTTLNSGRVGDPFVADALLVKSISVADKNVTQEVTTLGQANVQRTIGLAGISPGSFSFINPGIFSPKLQDASGTLVSKVLGVDTFILNSPFGKSFGVVAYNDPQITGRTVQRNDVFALNLSQITDEPVGTRFALTATPFVVAATVKEQLIDAAPEPGTLLLFASGFVGLVGWRRKQIRACSVQRAAL